jgi:hypothetical protein
MNKEIAVLEQQCEYDLFRSSHILEIIDEEKLPSQIRRSNP